MAVDLLDTHKFGKLDAEKVAVKFRLKRYVERFNEEIAAQADKTGVLGYDALISHWGSLGTDKYNVTTLAAFAHATALQARKAGTPIEFTDWSVLADYTSLTGFDYTPASDIGLVTADALEFWRTIGISDYNFKRHTIAGYATLKPRSLGELAYTIEKFGFALAGLEISGRALWQIGEKAVWDVNRRGAIRGKVLAPIVARRENGNYVAIVWGEPQELTPEFYQKYNDESVAVFSHEVADGTTDIQGFRPSLLQRDLRKLQHTATEELEENDGPESETTSLQATSDALTV